MRSTFLAAAVALWGFALAPGNASAGPLTWTLNSASFSDGGALNGSFVFDADH